MSTINTTYNSVTDTCCGKTILAIEKLNSNTEVQKPVGSWLALTSPLNKGTFSLQLDTNKGRPSTVDSFRKVYTKDIRPVCDQDTTADSACASPSFSGGDNVASTYVFAQHLIDLSIKREIDLDDEEFENFCINQEQYIMDKLSAFRGGVLDELNTKVNERLVTYMAAYSDQTAPDNSISDPKSVSFLVPNSAGGFVFDPTGYAKVKDEYNKLGYSYIAPIVVGGSQLSVFQTSSAFLGGTNVNGVTSTSVPNLFVDYGVDAVMNDGANHLFTWKPGALQVVSANAITDQMIKNSVPNMRERMRVTSPFGDGLTWDYYYDVASNGCERKIKFQLWFDVIQPVPYDDTCAKAPVLHFDTGCTANTCPSSGISGDGGL